MTERATLKALVDKLTEIEADRSFQGIWPFLHVHGYNYSGPDWRNDLAAARLALTANGEETDKSKEG